MTGLAPPRLPVVSPPPPGRPGYLRALDVGIRALHVLSMGLVLGGIAAGGTHETLRPFILATLGTGLALLVACVQRGCLSIHQGAGWALLLKLACLGLGNVFEGARLQWYAAATVITSVGSHMPSAWRHATLASLPRWPRRSGTPAP